jgi:hypothetical protein
MTFWLSGVIKIIFIILTGRLLLKDKRAGDCVGEVCAEKASQSGEGGEPRSFGKLLADTFWNQIRLFVRIASYYTFVTLTVLLCMEPGLFQWTDSLIGPMVWRFGLPSSIIPPLSAYVVSPVVGLTSISALLQSHEITDHQAIIALLVGGFLMVPIIYLRSMLPKYIVIFGVRLGALIVVLSVGFTLLARIIMLACVATGVL